MTKQFNIRSEKAYALASKHAQASGKPLAAIVEEALRDFDEKVSIAREKRAQKMHDLISAIQDEVAKSSVKFEIDDMYDEDGLPC